MFSLAPRLNAGTGKLGDGVGWAGVELTAGCGSGRAHVVFWLHQPEAVPAEVKLGDVHVRVISSRSRLRQHKGTRIWRKAVSEA